MQEANERGGQRGAGGRGGQLRGTGIRRRRRDKGWVYEVRHRDSLGVQRSKTFSDLGTVADLTYRRVRDQVNAMVQEGKRPSTVRNVVLLARRVLDEARKQRLIRDNPCVELTLPRMVASESNFLSRGQVRRRRLATLRGLCLSPLQLSPSSRSYLRPQSWLGAGVNRRAP